MLKLLMIAAALAVGQLQGAAIDEVVKAAGVRVAEAGLNEEGLMRAQAVWECNKCGRANMEGMNVCPYCGKRKSH